MEIRPSRPDDLDDILRVYEAARQTMRETGNPNQWGDSWPPVEVVRDDIPAGRSYVVTDDEGTVHGVFVLIIGEDPTYGYIEDGAWLDDEPYGTIHRIASDGQMRGVFAASIGFCLGKIGNLRIDTHADNAIMHHSITKAGFTRCGTIYLEDGSPRIAYQLHAR